VRLVESRCARLPLGCGVGGDVSTGRRESISRVESPTALARLDLLIATAIPVLEGRLQRRLEYRPPSVPIREGEAAGFFRSVDGGFFEVDKDALCIPRSMRPSTGFCYPLLQFPTRTSSTVTLWREWLTHAGLPALLHFDLRHARNDIALDVDAFDALVFSVENQPLIAVEAKKTIGELEKMVNEMSAIVQQPFKLRREPRLSNSEQKARSLLALRPRYFLAVAPEQASAFVVSYPPDVAAAIARLEPVPMAALDAAASM
jgi:hypothetical protein